MRSDYQPPSRKQLSEGILDCAHEKLTADVKQKLTGQVLSVYLDGWSNVRMEPVMSCSAVLQTRAAYLIDSSDRPTSGSPHTAEYLVLASAS